MANPMKDISGARFGRLVVLEYAGKYSGGTSAAWRCRCECGNEVVRSGYSLRIGQTFSCGCLRVEKLRARNTAGSKKVKSNPLYMTWRQMVRRCHDPSVNSYLLYGGRGIKVCDQWRDSFQAFLDDMGARPAGHTLDRIESGGDYSPENCRWATVKQQNNNRSNVRLVDVGGAMLGIPDACARFGVNPATAHHRLRRGWDILAAVSTPSGAITRWSRPD